jgi:hypothetical protein
VNKELYPNIKIQTTELKFIRIPSTKELISDNNIKTKFSSQATTCQPEVSRIWPRKNTPMQWVDKPKNKNKRDYKPKKTQNLKKF